MKSLFYIFTIFVAVSCASRQAGWESQTKAVELTSAEKASLIKKCQRTLGKKS